MMHQGVFLVDGPSDLPLSRHLESMCSAFGADVALTPVDPALLSDVGRTVADRLRFVADQPDLLEIVFVHRDAEGQPPERRFHEIKVGVTGAGLSCPVVPVVPVRMTEAWLLLDEAAIRRVAAKPNGTAPLDLPTWQEAERLADPKRCLQEVLLAASETTGRRRKQFERDFGRHRALLLERLDPGGIVATLTAWKRLEADVAEAVAVLSASR